MLAGPVEMGLLPYIPGLGHPIGADHVLVVVGLEGDMVRAQDVQGWPFVTMPMESLLAAWKGDSFVYPVEPYVVRTNFRREHEVDVHIALRRSLPNAVCWLENGESGTAAERLADIVEAGLTNLQYKYLVEFTVQGGPAARRGGGAAGRDQQHRRIDPRPAGHVSRLAAATTRPARRGGRGSHLTKARTDLLAAASGAGQENCGPAPGRAPART